MCMLRAPWVSGRCSGADNSHHAQVMTYEGHTNNATAIGFQRDGKWMYSGSEDKTVKIWDLRCVCVCVNGAATCSPPAEADRIATAIDAVALLHRARGCQRNYKCAAAINAIALHPNQGELITGDQQGNVRVWDLTANKFSQDWVRTTAVFAVWCLRAMPSCICLCVAVCGCVWLWLCLIQCPEGPTPLRSVAVAIDASLIVAANNKGNCFMWRPNGYVLRIVCCVPWVVCTVPRCSLVADAPQL